METMPQVDLAAAPGLAPRQRLYDPAIADAGSRLRLVGAGGHRAALTRLLSDFAIDRGAPPAALAAWSGGSGAARLRRRAASLGLPSVLLAEGLLRAPPAGRRRPLLSVAAIETSGPASAADRLDPARVLSRSGWETPALLARAAAARRALVAARIGGAWWRTGARLPAGEGFCIVDLWGAAPAAMQPMLAAAFAENPAEKVVVLRDPIDPWAAIAAADRVYAAGGETGFLALLAGIRVHCFADCFYAGWGATCDGPAVTAHKQRRDADQIFAGACLLATRCLDPFHAAPAEFEDIVDVLAEWRRVEHANRRIAACVGMSFWKRRRVADFLRSTAGVPAFRRGAASAVARAAATGGAVAVWATRMPGDLQELAARRGVQLIRVEDGFLRSVGLGSDFMPAASLALDERGAHYDPRTRSGLEILLRESEFDIRLIERARRLIDLLVARGITKYNLAASAAPVVAAPEGRSRILVPGQVEDDLSVQLGGGDIRTNLDLLARVRAANPGAYLVYKPHPDVEAGHRKGAVPDAEARRFADVVVREGAIPSLLAAVDELHTLTSLAGFEALLRRRRVVVYGRPFYAGWGLTEDVVAPSRGRRLSLEELVAGALILYPRYLDPVTRLPCGPEIVVERLADPELWRPGPLVFARRLQGAAARWWRR
jgi:capsular polysaccharide export protein